MNECSERMAGPALQGESALSSAEPTVLFSQGTISFGHFGKTVEISSLKRNTLRAAPPAPHRVFNKRFLFLSV